MELNVKRQAMSIHEVVYDGEVEQPIECDALLPDHCPDMVKLLKCTVDPHIITSNVSGSKLTVEGNAFAYLYYCTENGGLRQTRYQIPFARTVELRSAPGHPAITVVPSVEYVNCRAVNQRRIDLRGALRLSVRVSDIREEEVISDAEGGGLQLRREMMKTTEQLGRYESTFTLSDNLELGYGKAPVNSVLRRDVRTNLQDAKVISGKVVVKGELLLHLCYQALEEENRLETMEYTLPLSQIIDAESADEDCICDVALLVDHCDISPKQNEDGEYLQFALDARIKAVVTVHRHREIPVASDCYSTQYACQAKTRPASFVQLAEQMRESVMHKTALELPEEVESVLDAWCTLERVQCQQEGRELRMVLGLNIAMFARQKDGEVAYFEQGSEMEHRVALPEGLGNIRIDPVAEILSCTYSLPGGTQIEMRCEILLQGGIFSETRCNVLSDIALDEAKPKEKLANKLYIYYADEGESVWNIAKAYNTSASAIWEENAVEDDILPGKTMLLIPVV